MFAILKKNERGDNMIWNYSLTDIINGYAEDDYNKVCVICGKQYENGRIYEIDNAMYDSYGAIKQHVKKEHGNVASYLLQQELSVTGISEVQRQLLQFILAGKSDKEISNELGIAQSTVRNHRFKLREKEKQAKLFLALMSSLEKETDNKIEKSDTGIIEDIHMSATMIDDRYNITEKDREKTISLYMNENGALKEFPVREKKKIILLGEIIKNFKRNTVYSEEEVNRVLKRIYAEDHPTIRRALIEYGFMDRSADCNVYRVKE